MRCNEQLIPGLPDEIGLEILARVPRLQYANSMVSVCSSWSATIRGSSLLDERKRLKCSEAWIYAAVLSPKENEGSTLSWFAARAHAAPSGASEWLRLPSMPEGHNTLHGFQTAVIGHFIYVIGGFQGCSLASKYCQATNKVSVFDAWTNRWHSAPEMAVPRGNFACGVINGLVYIAGGESLLDSELHEGILQDASKNEMTQKSAEVFDPAVGKWSSLPGMQYSKQLVLGAAANGKLLVSGFHSEEYLHFEEIVEAYYPTENKWEVADPSYLEYEEQMLSRGDSTECDDRLPATLLGGMASLEFAKNGREAFVVNDNMDIVCLKEVEAGKGWQILYTKENSECEMGTPLLYKIIAT